MITKRIIACLDVHGGRVVKGVQFVDLVDEFGDCHDEMCSCYAAG